MRVDFDDWLIFGYHFEQGDAKILSVQCKINAFLTEEQVMNVLEAGQRSSHENALCVAC